MTRKRFDRFMVANNNGRNLKLARLTDAEFRGLIQGVWPIASEASPRGAFMVGKVPATDADVVFMAPSVSRRTARSLLEKLRELGMLEHDDELGGEWVHDFDVFNPTPKSDPTNAERQARFRERNAQSNGVTRPVTDAVTSSVTDDRVTRVVTLHEVEGEVEVEEEDPLAPRGGTEVTLAAPVKPTGNRDRDKARWQASFDAWVEEHFPGCEPRSVERLIQWVPRGIDPTPDAVREVVEASPNFAHLLEPAA